MRGLRASFSSSSRRGTLPGEAMRARTKVSEPNVRAVVARAKSATPWRAVTTIATVATPTAMARAPSPERSGWARAVRAACPRASRTAETVRPSDMMRREHTAGPGGAC